MSSLYNIGIRPIIDNYLLEKSKERRDYGEYFSASQAGYCMRKVIFDRLGVPHVNSDDDARKQRVFTAGHIFHQWMQQLTKEAGISIAQELELQDEELLIRGHIDDLVLVNDKLILYDYKTQNSRAFSYQKDRPMSHYHRMQLATYMYLLHKHEMQHAYEKPFHPYDEVVEARILKMDKDTLRMSEQELLWSDELEKEVVNYWTELNRYWKEKIIPPCTCHLYEGGFLASEKYNDYFYQGEPCSLNWYNLHRDKLNLDKVKEQ